MKEEQLKTIIDAFFDDWECPSNKVYSEHLAEWIVDAQSRPLKCEVK